MLSSVKVSRQGQLLQGLDPVRLSTDCTFHLIHCVAPVNQEEQP